MNNGVTPKLLLIAAPVTAIFLYWMWRRRRSDRPSFRSRAYLSSTARNASSSNRQKITLEVEVPEKAIGFVIGRGGQNIRKIENETGARVRLMDGIGKDGMATTTIMGFPSQVSEAEALVRHAIAERQRKDEAANKKSYTVEIVLSRNVIGRVIGRQGETIRGIEASSRARVRVETSPTVGMEERLCTITGSEEETQIAANLVRDLIAKAVQDDQRDWPGRRMTHQPNPRLAKVRFDPLDIDWTQLAARLPTTTDGTVDVFVSELVSPSLFWVQVISPEAQALEPLVEGMSLFYDMLNYDDYQLNKVGLGDVCAVREILHDDTEKWYRARVIQVDAHSRPSEVQVICLDYGSKVFCEVKDVKVLRPEFLDLPFQAVQCSLDGVQPKDGHEDWPEETFVVFSDLTFLDLWIPLILQFDPSVEQTRSDALQPRSMPVKLIDTTKDFDVDVGEELIRLNIGSRTTEHQFGTPCEPEAEASPCNGGDEVDGVGSGESSMFNNTSSNSSSMAGHVLFLSPKSIDDGENMESLDFFDDHRDGVTYSSATGGPRGLHARLPDRAYGDVVQVRVTAVTSPSHFWVQLGSEVESMERLNDEMTEYYSDLALDSLCMKEVAVGTLCCAIYGHDETWHRARVTSIVDDEYACVQYLDYGDTGQVRLDNVKDLKDKYLTSMPFQAILCQMVNIKPTEGEEWSREAIDKFEQLTHAGSWQCNLLNRVLPPEATADVPEVEIFGMVEEGVSVSQMMVTAEQAVWSSPRGNTFRRSRGSLSSEPSKLVEQALEQVEEADMEKSVRRLPKLVSGAGRCKTSRQNSAEELG